MKITPQIVVLISADAEWRVVRNVHPVALVHHSPYGEWFLFNYDPLQEHARPVVFFHGGWGKVAAAGSTQYAISKWQPHLIVNIGTCGGIEGQIDRGKIILADQTIIYDIYEQMGDPDEHSQYYMTHIDNSWLDGAYPIEVIKTLLVSGDRDLFCQEVMTLASKFGAVAGDWESGAIAWISAHSKTQCLILRGVTDLVGVSNAEAYKNMDFYIEQTDRIMRELLDSLPKWLARYLEYISEETKKVINPRRLLKG